MSHSSAAIYPAHHHAGRHAPKRTHPAAAARHVPRRHDGYTFEHGGRRVRIGPVAFWIVVGTLVIMAAWSVGTGTYFAFRQDVITRLIGREAKMQFAYEDRIADLRARIDRITSRQLLDQQQFQQKLNELKQRQATLERRSEEISGDVLTTNSLPSAHRRRPAHGGKATKSSSYNESALAPPDSLARLDASDLPQGTFSSAPRSKPGGLEDALGRISASLDKVAKRQSVALLHLEKHLDNKEKRMRSVLNELGVNILMTPAKADVGGPYDPLMPPRPGASAFDRAVYQVDLARAHIDRYEQALLYVPVHKPLGVMEVTSPFGMRSDPFLGTPEMHTGIDLAGAIGEPVHATANGTVKRAGWDGGYGNLVEIDNGNGFFTRFGHLSQIDVKVGQKVKIGQVIGKIGSTGRSTGPHLHYETRVNGQAVNPEKFLQAGIKLGHV